MNYGQNLIIKDRKKKFIPNTRIRLVSMEKEPYARLKEGDKGTVQYVDDIGTVHIRWDSGILLGAVLEDEIELANKS